MNDAEAGRVLRYQPGFCTQLNDWDILCDGNMEILLKDGLTTEHTILKKQENQIILLENLPVCAEIQAVKINRINYYARMEEKA